MSQSKYILFLLFFLFYTNSDAQTYFGYRGGITFAKVSASQKSFIKDERRTGYNASIFFNFRNKNKLIFQPEISLIQKGFIESRGKLASNRITYLDLAFLAKYNVLIKDNNIRKREKHICYLIVGPYIGGLISFKRKNLEGDELWDGDKSHLNKADLGALFGGGFGIPFGRGSLIFDFRYDMGIINANDGRIPGNYLRHQNIMLRDVE